MSSLTTVLVIKYYKTTVLIILERLPSRQPLFFIEKSKRSSQFQNNQDGRFDVRNIQDGRFASLLIKTIVSILLVIKTVVRTNSFNQDGRKRSKIIRTVVLQYFIIKTVVLFQY